MTQDTPRRRDEPFPSGGTALLLVDMQRKWLEPGANPAHPDWGPDHYLYREVRERAVPNQLKLLAAARKSGAEVIHTVIRSLTSDGRDRSLDHKLSSLHVAPDDPLGDVLPDIAPAHDEILLPKTSSGVFNSTALDYLLGNLGITHVVTAGIMTDQCIDMAVRDGADRGYMMTCVADACAATTEERHRDALRAFGGYCWVTDTDTVCERLETMSSAR